MKTVMEVFCEDCPYYEPDISSMIDYDGIDPYPCQNEHICERVAKLSTVDTNG